MQVDHEELISLTADIVSAFVSNNSIPGHDVATVITNVYATLQGLSVAPPVEEPAKPKGAVSIRASVKPDHLVSMIDGKSYKMLKRHLSLNGYTPQSYGEAFGLPADYPMVAASYAERRTLAKKIGLGRKPGPLPKTAPAKRGGGVRKPK